MASGQSYQSQQSNAAAPSTVPAQYELNSDQLQHLIVCPMQNVPQQVHSSQQEMPSLQIDSPINPMTRLYCYPETMHTLPDGTRMLIAATSNEIPLNHVAHFRDIFRSSTYSTFLSSLVTSSTRRANVAVIAPTAPNQTATGPVNQPSTSSGLSNRPAHAVPSLSIIDLRPSPSSSSTSANQIESIDPTRSQGEPRQIQPVLVEPPTNQMPAIEQSRAVNDSPLVNMAPVESPQRIPEVNDLTQVIIALPDAVSVAISIEPSSSIQYNTNANEQEIQVKEESSNSTWKSLRDRSDDDDVNDEEDDDEDDEEDDDEDDGERYHEEEYQNVPINYAVNNRVALVHPMNRQENEQIPPNNPIDYAQDYHVGSDAQIDAHENEENTLDFAGFYELGTGEILVEEFPPNPSDALTDDDEEDDLDSSDAPVDDEESDIDPPDAPIDDEEIDQDPPDAPIDDQVNPVAPIDDEEIYQDPPDAPIDDEAVDWSDKFSHTQQLETATNDRERNVYQEARAASNDLNNKANEANPEPGEADGDDDNSDQELGVESDDVLADNTNDADSELSINDENVSVSNKNKTKKLVRRLSSKFIIEKPQVEAILKSRYSKKIKIGVKDKNCWDCHRVLDDTQIHCKRCGLGWHKKCTGKVFRNTLVKKKAPIKYERNLKLKQAWINELPSVVDPEICIECARKEAGFVFCLLLGFLTKKELNQYEVMKRVATTFKYTIQRLYNHKDENGATMFTHLEKIDYSDCEVRDRIDFEWIHNKTSRINKYHCTEEFMFDIKLLWHSYVVLQYKTNKNLKYNKIKPTFDKLLAIVNQELEAIDRCDSCYRNYYEVDYEKIKTEMWMPCERGHSLVWAPNHQRFWPAKVYEYRETNYFYISDEFVWIEHFGENKNPKWIRIHNRNPRLRPYLHTFSRVPPDDTNESGISIFRKTNFDKRGVLYAQSLIEAEYYHTKYWKRYFTEEYDLRDLSEVFSLDNLFMDYGQLRNPGFDENFKIEEGVAVDVPSTSGKRKAKKHPPGSKKNSNGTARSMGPVSNVANRPVGECTCGKEKAPKCTVHVVPPNEVVAD